MTRRRAGSHTREWTASVAHIEQRESPDETGFQVTLPPDKGMHRMALRAAAAANR